MDIGRRSFRLDILKRMSPWASAKTAVRRFLKRPGSIQLLHGFNAHIRALSGVTHRWQYFIEWRVSPPPEWFDTYLDQHHAWHDTRAPWKWDRGVYNVLGMRAGARVLELCCGGGFFTYHFYAGRASNVIAVDFDPTAIAHARRYNAAPNVKYDVLDVRDPLPAGPFDHVVWDAAIEHFTSEEIMSIVHRLKEQMAPDGIVSGYTIQERPDGSKQHPDHEYEFTSMADLASVFSPHFKNVLVFETIYPERHNLHFIASDGAIPFGSDWPHAYRATR